MNRRTKQKISCVLLICAGVALIIGGSFIPALLIPGVPILVAGLGVLGALFEDKDKIAFNTTINNTYNHCDHDGAIIRSETTTERVKAKFNFGPSVGQRITEWNERLRELFSNAPIEMNLNANSAPILTFSQNYKAKDKTTAKGFKLALEDIKEEPMKERAASLPELEELDIANIDKTYKLPREFCLQQI